MRAEPSSWSEESRRSYAYDSITEYVDEHYKCWRCQTEAVFTAKDQKRSFEVGKNYYWQRRILCEPCWREANEVRKRLEELDERWQREKARLSTDGMFLKDWLALLEKLEEYVPYKSDTAKKNMISKLLEKNA